MAVTGTLSTAENEAIEELRKRMSDEFSPQTREDFHMLYRFLKARDWNLDKAEAMLRKHFNWIKEYNVEDIEKNFKTPEVFAKYFPNCIVGFDKEGNVVKYNAFGELDPKGFRKSIKQQDFVNSVIQLMMKDEDMIKKQNEKLGKTTANMVCIFDLKNWSLSATMDRKSGELYALFFSWHQDNFPERLKAVYVLNAPYYFSSAFTFLKPYLASSVLQKVNFLTPDKQKDELLKVIDADVLPAFLGGDKKDPDGDPQCKSFINHAGKIPSEYFTNKGRAIPLAKEEGVRKLVLRPFSKSEVEVRVEEPGSFLEWEIELKGRDIGFGLVFRKGEERVTSMLPQLRLEADEINQEGGFLCQEAGTYALVFDNSYSWLRFKEIHYRTKVVKKEEHEARIVEANI